MADRRHLFPTGLGSPGLLVYIPSKNPGKEPGRLETTRFTSRFPHFRVLGPINTLYPSSKRHLPETSSRLWRERRVQERWLFKSQPELYMGNTSFQDILKDDMQHFKISDDPADDRPLLAVGHMPDLSDKSGARVLSVMAVAAGESAELLRLALMDDTQWQWGQNRDAFLNISAVDPSNKEAETTWASDSFPIQQVKFAANSLQEDDPLRWLFVQKQTSTTILRPEYQHIITKSDPPNDMSIEQRPSFLNPNPLLTIHYHETGGRAHSDVVLVPTAHGRLPQIAIIDECGYWSLWELHGTWQIRQKSTARLLMKKCGHISDGLLDELPSSTSYPAEKHGLLVVGSTEEPELLKRSPSQSSNGGSADSVGRHLVIWNREKFEILDLDTNTLLLKLEPLLTQKLKPDWIIDIQRSPVHQNDVFVLTQHHIIWVDVFHRSESRKRPSGPSVILSCPHLGTKHVEANMFVCRASHDDAETSLVFVHYPKSRQLSIFWFTVSSARVPQWHRDTISLPGTEGFQIQHSIQLIRVDAANLAASVDPDATSPGITYHHKGVRFYQLTFLGDDLGLRHCLCATTDDPLLEISVPTTRVAWAEAKLQDQRDKRRRLLMNRIEGAFALPDELTMDDIDSLLLENSENGQPQESDKLLDVAPKPRRPVNLNMNKLCLALQQMLEQSINKGATGLPSRLFEALRQKLDEGNERGKLPLLTWSEVAGSVIRSEEYEPLDEVMKEDMESLLDLNDEKIVITQLRRFTEDEGPESLISFQYLLRSFQDFWLSPIQDIMPEEVRNAQQIWVAELARDAFLSNYGIMIQDTPLLGPAVAEAEAEAEQEGHGVASSSQIKSSQISRSSGSSSRDTHSSPAPSKNAPATDGALQRLQLLAPSLRIKKLDVSKQSKILSYWPTERGVDPKDYVSSLAKANEDLFNDAKERLQKIESKRKARADKYKRPAFMRQGLPNLGSEPQSRPPPVQVMSSQAVPESSQVQGPGFTMSQPVPGAFGDRQKSKKAKRKSGFR